jgi:hypothetical protein
MKYKDPRPDIFRLGGRSLRLYLLGAPIPPYGIAFACGLRTGELPNCRS